jgi:hypothetical protein
MQIRLKHQASTVLFTIAALLMLTRAGAARADGFSYTVQSGDSISSISNRFLEYPAYYWKVQQFNKIVNDRALRPGSTLVIPAALMRREPANAKAIAVNGVAALRGSAAPNSLQAGDPVQPGATIATGRGGSVVLELADGSILRIPQQTEVQLQSSLKSYDGSGYINMLRLIGGRVETQVKKLGGTSRFEISTPTAAAGVRGTDFRVSYDVTSQRTRSEVLEGGVAFSGAAASGNDKASTVMLAAGTGSIAGRDGKPTTPSALLGAPEFAALDPALQERPVVRFPLKTAAGATQYRAQVGTDVKMDKIITENVFDSAEVKFAELPDGDYVLRVRAIDSSGLEGLNRLQAFKLKARPEPPLAQTPAPNGKARGESAMFVWGESTEGNTYRFQLARDAAFRDIVHEEIVLKSAALTSRPLPPGTYYWRVASSRADGDAGPWGDARGFNLLPPSAPPQAAESATEIQFSWTGEAGQKFVFQVARDREFKQLIAETATADTLYALKRPAPGAYFSRLRAIDADGFIGPFTPPQRFEILNRLEDGAGASISLSDGKPVKVD